MHGDTIDQAVEVEYDSEENGVLITSLGFCVVNIYGKMLDYWLNSRQAYKLIV